MYVIFQVPQTSVVCHIIMYVTIEYNMCIVVSVEKGKD
jgi:hypothetical protein